MYAYALIEDPRDNTRYVIGDILPDDLPGLQALADQGAAGVDIIPHVQISSGDSGTSEENTNG